MVRVMGGMPNELHYSCQSVELHDFWDTVQPSLCRFLTCDLRNLQRFGAELCLIATIVGSFQFYQ